MKTKKKPNLNVVKLKQKLLAAEVLEAKETILNLAQEYNFLSIDLSNIKEADTFGIQLLISVLQSKTPDRINFFNTTESFRTACKKIGVEYQIFETQLEIVQ